MTSITLTDEQLDRLAERVAAHLADRLPPPGRSPLVTAAQLAAVLGVARETVYQHAAELGARHVGDGPKPRLRFDVDQALERWTARQSNRESHPPDPPAAAGRSRRRRERAAGSGVELLPVGGRKGQVPS